METDNDDNDTDDEPQQTGAGGAEGGEDPTPGTSDLPMSQEEETVDVGEGTSGGGGGGGGGGGDGVDDDDDGTDNSDDDDIEEEEEDPFMEIEIDNPEPRPVKNFLVANSLRPHNMCTPPHTFPPYCTVIVKEGDPTDFIASRGLCSILGIIRDKQPNIVSNKCIVRNIKNMKYIAIEFIDGALNTFKIAAGGRPMWIKIDLRVIKNAYY